MGSSLYWVTNTEFMNESFEIERSLDGETFVLIQRVESRYDAFNIPYNYRKTDQSPKVGPNYYRIKKIHHDGSHTYSNVELLTYEIDPETIILYPNPAENEAFISVVPYAGAKASLSIVNQLGQTVANQVFDTLTTDPIKIDLGDYNQGIYYVVIKIEDQKVITKKLIISKL